MKQGPIDIVITWVDGSDPKWLEEKAKYSDEVTTYVHEYNYQEWGMLKYWFRGIEKNAPWVRNIFFVTWGHLPSWLNTDHPKLRIINHRDFIPEEYLPTFSANPIELNLHRIPGLADQFIFFNDDMYLIRKSSPEDFFIDGLPRDSAVVNPIAPKSRYTINSLQFTNAAVINENFSKKQVMRKNPAKWFNMKYHSLILLNLMFLPWGRFPGLLEMHIPSSFLKKTYEEVWEAEREILDATSRHRFRDFKNDVNQWLLKEWQICKGEFVPRSTKIGKAYRVEDLKGAEVAAEALKKRKYKMICVNDHLDGMDDTVMKVLTQAFEEVFPEKSGFEK